MSFENLGPEEPEELKRFFARDDGAPGMSRRGFLAVSAMIAAGLFIDVNAAAIIDSEFERAILPPTKTEIVWKHPPSAEDLRRPVLVVPGLGHSSGLDSADKTQEAFPDTNVAYAKFSNKGPNIEGVAEVVADEFREAEAMSIVGPSMGTPLAVKVAQLIRLPVSDIVSISSPTRIKDANLGVFAGPVAEWLKVTHAYGGLGMKALVDLALDIEGDAGNIAKIKKDIQNLPHQVLHGNPLPISAAEIIILNDIDLLLNAPAFAKVVTPNTNISYAGSANPVDDTIVRILQAEPHMRHFAEQCGANVKFFDVNMGHADVRAASRVFASHNVKLRTPA